MFEFQTAISELTGLPVANASLYEGPSSVASAAYLALGARRAASGWSSRGACTRIAPDARDVRARLRRRGGRGRPARMASPTRPSSRTTSTRTSPPSSFRTRTSSARWRTSRRSRPPRTSQARSASPPSTRSRLGVLRPPGECGVDIALGEGQPLGGRLDYGGPVVRILRRDRGAPAPHARPDRRRDDRRRRPPRLRARAPDPRAAHPPREGDPQHLHLAGAQRARRRRLPRLARQARVRRARRAARPPHRLRERAAGGVEGVELLHPTPRSPASSPFGSRRRWPRSSIGSAARGSQRGIALGRDYPEYEDALLVAITERRSRENIDRLADVARPRGRRLALRRMARQRPARRSQHDAPPPPAADTPTPRPRSSGTRQPRSSSGQSRAAAPPTCRPPTSPSARSTS